MTHSLDWLYDGSPIPDPAGRAERAVRFLRSMKHPKSTLPGQAFRLDQWQERIVRRIYGPNDADGQRRIRTVYLQVGKGSRKTSLAAGLATLHTFGPEKVERGQNFVAAADRSQARVAFEEAASIVEATDKKGRVRPVDSKNRLIHIGTKSRFEAVSSDGKKKHGATPNFVLVDELWAHEKPELWHALRTGVTKVAGSLLIVATTAGRGNESPDFPIYEYAKKVQRGAVEDPTFLPIIFEADKDDAWDDEKVWHRVMPGLQHGYPDLPSLRQLANEARERPADRAAFEQFYLGIRQDNSLSPYVDMRVFDEGRMDGLQKSPRNSGFSQTRAELPAIAAPCWIAVDMSTTTDLTAVLACFHDGDEFIILCWGFVPAENLRRRSERDRVPYQQWADEGWIIPTDGAAIDYRVIEQHIRTLCNDHDVREIVFDPAYAGPVMGPLTDSGLPTATLPQWWKTQSPALNVLERAILEKKLKWESPVLRWCVENVAIQVDRAGNRVMNKGKSRERIDLAVTLWMAVSRAAAHEEASAYSDERWRPEMAWV